MPVLRSSLLPVLCLAAVPCAHAAPPTGEPPHHGNVTAPSGAPPPPAGWLGQTARA